MIGVGISVQSMINSLRNNSRKKGRVKYFERKSSSKSTEPQIDNKLLKRKASPELLEKIRNEVLKDKKKARIKSTLLITVALILTIIIIVYIQINYLELIKKLLSICYSAI